MSDLTIEHRLSALEHAAHKHDVREVGLQTSRGNGEHSSYTHQFSGPPIPVDSQQSVACVRVDVFDRVVAEHKAAMAELRLSLSKANAALEDERTDLANVRENLDRVEDELREALGALPDNIPFKDGNLAARIRFVLARESATSRTDATFLRAEIANRESEIRALKKHDHAGVCVHPDYLALKAKYRELDVQYGNRVTELIRADMRLGEGAARDEFVLGKREEQVQLLKSTLVRIRNSCGAELDHDMTRDERRNEMRKYYEDAKITIDAVTTLDQDIRHDRR